MPHALTWMQTASGNGAIHADTEFERYTVWDAAGTCWMHPLGAHRGMPGSPDIESAKAIAQAHCVETVRVRDHYAAGFVVNLT